MPYIAISESGRDYSVRSFKKGFMEEVQSELDLREWVGFQDEETELGKEGESG